MDDALNVIKKNSSLIAVYKGYTFWFLIVVLFLLLLPFKWNEIKKMVGNLFLYRWIKEKKYSYARDKKARNKKTKEHFFHSLLWISYSN